MKAVKGYCKHVSMNCPAPTPTPTRSPTRSPTSAPTQTPTARPTFPRPNVWANYKALDMKTAVKMYRVPWKMTADARARRRAWSFWSRQPTWRQDIVTTMVKACETYGAKYGLKLKPVCDNAGRANYYYSYHYGPSQHAKMSYGKRQDSSDPHLSNANGFVATTKCRLLSFMGWYSLAMRPFSQVYTISPDAKQARKWKKFPINVDYPNDLTANNHIYWMTYRGNDAHFVDKNHQRGYRRLGLNGKPRREDSDGFTMCA
jgi:hypothetical protein